MSTVSEVTICNQALTWLGQNPITSLDDQNTTAEWMKINYPHLRDAVLMERTWTFATARSKSVSNTTDEWGVAYVHPVPGDWLGVLRCYRQMSGANPNGWTPSEGWRMEDNQILANQSTLYLWGVRQVTDTGRYSSLFVQALAARIAADAAIPMTENRQLMSDMWALYGDKLSMAAARDGQQGDNDVINQTTLTGVRYSGGLIR